MRIGPCDHCLAGFDGLAQRIQNLPLEFPVLGSGYRKTAKRDFARYSGI